MANGPTKKENAAAKKARIERERAGQYHVLWHYYATGGGSNVPPGTRRDERGGGLAHRNL